MNRAAWHDDQTKVATATRRMMPPPSRVIRGAAVVLAGLLVWMPQALAADHPDREIDVILLIDASGSMSSASGDLLEGHRTGVWTGSDTQRIRWDAVKLLLDLLDANDRILIQRFNHACPAEPYGYMSMQGQSVVPYGPFRPVMKDRDPLDDAGDVLPADQIFSKGFVQCDRAGRAEAERCLKRVNAPLSSESDSDETFGQAKDGRSLDQGATNIFDALESIAPFLKDHPRRPKRVILLTDGCDDFIDGYFIDPDKPSCRVDSQKIAAKMAAFTEHNVPVYPIGLKLEALADDPAPEPILSRYVRDKKTWEKYAIPFRRTKARQLLKAIAAATNGTPHEVEKADELRAEYESLIRTLKGLWHKTETVRDQDRFSIAVTTSVANFRLLASAPGDGASAKKSTVPPETEPGRWQGSEEAAALPIPEHRRGTMEETPLYSLWYGGSVEAGKPSPYASLIGRHTSWVIPLRSASQEIRVTQFKDIHVDFGWPPGKTVFYRHEQAVVKLEARQTQLNAGDIEWTLEERSEALPARIFPDRQAAVLPDRSQVAIAHIDHSFREAEAEGPLRLNWSLSAVGTDRALEIAGFRREFSEPWTYEVRNELPYKAEARTPPGFTRKKNSVDFGIRTLFENAVPSIPMRATLKPPAVRGEPLAARLFKLKANGEEIPPQQDGWNYLFSLKGGAAEITLTLDTTDGSLRPDEKEEFSPGKLRIVPDVGDLVASAAEFELPVIIDRPQLRFFQDPAHPEDPAMISFSLVDESSMRVETVYLAPEDAIEGDVQLKLDYVDEGFPKLADGTATEFSGDDLQILGPDGSPLPRSDGGLWTVRYTKEPVPLKIQTKMTAGKWQSDSKAKALLIATGKGFTTGRAPLNWKFDPRRVEVSVSGDRPVIEPGKTVNYELKGAVKKGENACLLDLEPRNAVEFFAVPRQRGARPAFSCAVNASWELAASGAEEKAAPTRLALAIPSIVGAGEYEATLRFSKTVRKPAAGGSTLAEGTEAKEKTLPEGVCDVDDVTLGLEVNRLVVEVQPLDPTRDGPADGKWVKAASRDDDALVIECCDWLGRRRSYWVRVGSEWSGESTAVPQVGKEALEPLVIQADTKGFSVPGRATLTPSGMSGRYWLGQLTIPPIQNQDPANPYGIRFDIHRDGRLGRMVLIRLPLLEL